MTALELGAFPEEHGTRFTLWSTVTRSAEVRLFDAQGGVLATESLEPLEGSVFSRSVPGVRPGTLYKFVLDGEEVGDPYARFLPSGVFGPARVEPSKKAPALAKAADLRTIYELHVGTFTSEGTYRAAGAKLDYLVELGVSAIELMPIAAFAGKRGWGYDGVAPFAPFAPYGEPDELRAFVAAAHARGLSVLLDVVYNHLGPAGAWFHRYAPEYFKTDTHTAWGPALNYECPFWRRAVLGNARYWFEEFGFDGLRLDATHAIFDDSAVHVLRELRDVADAQSPRRVLIAEDERNEPELVERCGMDAIWADDFHHAVCVNLTGEQDGYYAAYTPRVESIARTIERGWLYEGQPYPLTGRPRGGSSSELAWSNFVYCIQNHDQVGNRAFGTRLCERVPPLAYAAASMLLLFLPMPALLFMGQEWCAKTPFLFFTDHTPDLGKLVTEGRRSEFKQFAAFSDPAEREKIPDPQALATFESSRLAWSELEEESGRHTLALYRRLLELRNSDPVLSAPSERGELEAKVVDSTLLVLRRSRGEERLLALNFGADAVPFEPARAGKILVASGLSGAALPRYGAAIVAGNDLLAFLA